MPVKGNILVQKCISLIFKCWQICAIFMDFSANYMEYIEQNVTHHRLQQ